MNCTCILSKRIYIYVYIYIIICYCNLILKLHKEEIILENGRWCVELIHVNSIQDESLKLPSLAKIMPQQNLGEFDFKWKLYNIYNKINQ